MNVKTTAVILTVIWNCRNFLTASLTARPHISAVMVEEKLSSRRIIELASLATSVPAMPMENPTSAIFRAGPSFVPSPVTATVSPRCFNLPTRIRLSSGDERARTRRFGRILSISSSDSWRNFGPSMTIAPSVMIPQLVAMALAVVMLSPVTILTTTPECWHWATASTTPTRRGSWIPTTPTQIISWKM